VEESDRPYLIETSAWIPTLRRGPTPAGLRERVRSLVAARHSATTGIVRLELLAAARDPREYDRVYWPLASSIQLPIDEQVCDEAAGLGFRLRRAGLVAQTTDLLIAAVAIRWGATLVHRDADFDRIAKHSPLAVESYL
jgi:predicted nucleic acid-binding protein